MRQENEREDQREGVHNGGPAVMYGAETWALKKAQEKKLGGSQKWECYDGCAALRSWTRSEMKKNKRDNDSGGNHKESPGKEDEVVWTCDEKRGTLRRKEGDGDESTEEKE